MTDLFNVVIKAVPLSSQDSVGAVLEEMLGPDSANKIDQLFNNGGLAFSNLNQQAANVFTSKLRNAGATVSIESSDDESELYRVRLVSFGEQRIQVIKQVRAITGLGLGEAKELVNSLGIVLDRVDQPTAEKAQQSLEGVGATVLIEKISNADTDQPDTSEVFYQVRGKVTLSGEPISGVLVRAFDRDLRSEQFLGEASTLQNGDYTILYRPEQFARSEKNNADLLLKVFNEVGALLLLDFQGEEIHFNAPKVADIDLQLADSVAVKASEFERLEALLRPAMDGAVLSDLSQQDIKFLTKETEIDKFSDEFPESGNSIHLMVQSAKLASQTIIPIEAYYAWARLKFGLTPNENSSAQNLSLDALLEKSDEQLKNGLEQAIEGFITPFFLTKQIDSIISQIQRLRDEKRREERELWTEHQARGILVNAQSNKALDGYIVSTSTEQLELSISFESSITNAQGEFDFTYALPPESTDSSLSLSFTISAPNGEQLDQQVLKIEVGQAQAVTIKVTIPVPAEPGERVLVDTLPIEFSSELMEVLEANNLGNIADLRKVGNLNKLDGLPNNLEGSDELKQLQAHVDLSMLAIGLEPEQQIAQNQLLIDKGFNSYIDIADMPVERFTTVLGDGGLNTFQPELLHRNAVRLNHQIDNIYLDGLLGNRGEEVNADLPDPALSCQCEDCVSALSPGAYITDLIGYVTKNVVHRESGQAITLDFLVDKFHQPLSKLPINCAATKTQVRQVRIACEVLLESLDPADLSSHINDEKIAQYRQQVYQRLLIQIGTSQFDLDRASSSAEFESIASRVGISPEFVEALKLKSNAHQLLENAVSEQNLERIFGLPAFIQMHNDSGVPRARLLDPLRFLKTEQPLPELYNWRLRHAKEQWKKEDFPPRSFGQTLPIIDPDIISPADFRDTDAANSPAFALWLARREWVDSLISDLHGLIIVDRSNPVPGLNRALEKLPIVTTTDEIIAQYELLTTHGKIVEGDAFDQWLSDRRLTVDRLSTLSKYVLSLKKATQFSDEDWQTNVSDVTNILVTALKENAQPAWVAEEQTTIVMDLNTFGPALTEPDQGEWSILLEQDRPLIDPESVETIDLPDGDFGKQAHQLWQQRQDKLAQAQKEFKAILETKDALRINPLLEMVYQATPDPATGNTWQDAIEKLDADSKSLDLVIADQAKETIRNDLFLSEQGFQLLVSVSLLTQDPEKLLDNTTLNELLGFLTSAHKQKVLIGNWIQEEIDSSLPYWKLLKARLPKWRSDISARQAWKRAFEEVNDDPLIDPDIISGEFIERPVVGNTAFDLWRSRTNAIDGELNKIQSFDVSRSDAVSQLLQAYLGVSVDQLIELSEFEDRGLSINPHLQQLSLPKNAYLFLLEIIERVDTGSIVLDESWDNVHAILLQVWKQKQFARWRAEEEGQIILSADFFTIPEQPFSTTIPNAQRWRVSARRQRTWLRTLKARIEQQETLASSLRNIVSEVEEQTLPLLRNALIEIIDKSTDELSIKAAKLTKQFLVGMQIGGCQTTTRVSMGLELLQTLVFSIRSGELKIAGEPLSIESKVFEKEWKWMGSYATWKAAMGVFLYPEQILYPSLRVNETPHFRGIKSIERLSPSEASRLAKDYYSYLQDICSLQVKVTCVGRTSIENTGSSGSNQYSVSENQRDALFIFALTTESQKIYWSIYDSQKEIGVAHSYWQELGALETIVLDIVGAATYRGHLYLFLHTIDDGSQGLGLIKLDLDSGVWGELITLSVPQGVESFTAVLVQQNLNDEEEDRHPPSVICAGQGFQRRYLYYKIETGENPYYEQYDTEIYFNSINSAEDGWNYEKWRVVSTLTGEFYEDSVRGLVTVDAAIRYENSFLVYLKERLIGIRLLVLDSNALSASLNEFVGDSELLAEYKALKSKEFWTNLKLHLGGIGSVSDRELSEIEQSKNKLGSNVDDTYQGWMDGQQHGNLLVKDFIGSFYWHKKDVFVFSKDWHTNGSYSSLHTPDKIHNDEARLRLFYDFPKSPAFSGDMPYSMATHNGKPLLANRFAIIYNAIEGGKSSVFGPALVEVSHVNGKLEMTRAISLAPRIKSISRVDRTAMYPKKEEPIPLTLKENLSEREERKKWMQVNTPYTHVNSRYFNEAYYFFPVWIALRLCKAENFEDALTWFRVVYDYKSVLTTRKVPWILNSVANLDRKFNRDVDWLSGINPHAVASNRSNTYTKFTVISIVRCLLDYADSEFTFDTSESVARARQLYTTALELIDSELPAQPIDKCLALINSLTFDAEDATLQPYYDYLKTKLSGITQTDILKDVLAGVKAALATSINEEKRLDAALEVIEVALGEKEPRLNALEIISNSDTRRTEVGRLLLNISNDSYRSTEIERDEINNFSSIDIEYTPRLSYGFCIPNNPTSRYLRLRAELNLFKIRNCMNIAGMKRELEPYAAPLDVESALPSIGAGGQINLGGLTRIRPTFYRYTVLLDRAKQLTSLAQQTEASFFSILQSQGQEEYTLLKARQDVELSREGVKLQKLRVKESKDGVGLAELQLERTSALTETYAEWLSEGMLKLESNLLDEYQKSSEAQKKASNARHATQAAQAAAQIDGPFQTFLLLGVLGGIAAEAYQNQSLISHQLEIQELSLKISVALRNREYELQYQLAQQDQEIGNQQIKLANDRVRITEQEQAISEIQSEQASDTVVFLQEKFTNIELYDWMSGVLENIFRYYLQQASSLAKLAEIQLAFERQEALVGVIKNDYYELPNNDGNNFENNDSSSVDRRGLTGSARLLRDLTKLDQYAFQTDQRKQQLSVNLSLSQLDPFAFQQFKQTGVLNFDTPGKLFDRRFPGQYLRLIKRVRISVIALVPPVEGVNATLTSSGISRVTIAGDVFQTTVIRRDPESIAFTNPIGATGVFELNPNPDMLFPFEGNGVDARWEFRLPKATNQMDFNSIADVLLTIEYTALHARNYQEQVQKELDNFISFDRAFSMRREFSDAWYDLHNPAQTASPMSVSFETELVDFPPNIKELSISRVLMYFVTEDNLPSAFTVKLYYSQNEITSGGESSPIDGVIRSNTNGTNWASISGRAPAGKWRVELPNTPVIKQLFKDEKIEDILLVLTCNGELPTFAL